MILKVQLVRMKMISLRKNHVHLLTMMTMILTMMIMTDQIHENIWRKRRKLSDQNQMSSTIQGEVTNLEQKNSSSNQMKSAKDYQKCRKNILRQIVYTSDRNDHQVPTVVPVQHDDFMVMSNRSVTERRHVTHSKIPFIFSVDILYPINFVNYQ